MPKVSVLYPQGGDWFNGENVGAPAAYTIKAVDVDDQLGEDQGVLVFEETDKKMRLNKTNAEELSNVFGDEMSDWVGKQVKLFRDPSVRYKGKRVGGVRVQPIEEKVAI